MVYHDDGTFTISCSIRVNDAEFFAHTFVMIHESSSVLLMMQFFCVHITGHHESTVISRRRLTICCEVKVERKKETSFTFNAMRQKCPRHTVWKSPKRSHLNFCAKIQTTKIGLIWLLAKNKHGSLRSQFCKMRLFGVIFKHCDKSI